MKYPFRIFLAILSVFVLTLNACSNRDASKIQEAEKMIVTNPDSAMTMLREVVNPHLLPDSAQALYWLSIANIHSNLHQSLSEDSMVCWSADFYLNAWQDVPQNERTSLLTKRMLKAQMLKVFYYWWINEKETAYKYLEDTQSIAQEINDSSWMIMPFRLALQISLSDHDFQHVREYGEALLNSESKNAIHSDEIVTVYNGIAVACYNLGDYDAMEKYFEQAIQSAQTERDTLLVQTIVRRNYADLLGELGHYDRAINMHKELLQYYSDEGIYPLGESYCSLSRLYLLKGDKKRAQELMRKAEASLKDYESRGDYQSVRGNMLAYRQILDYALTGKLLMSYLWQYNNELEESIHLNNAISAASEQQKRDLREQILRQTLSRQRQITLIIVMIFIMIGLSAFSIYLYRRRKNMLIEKEEEIETLRKIFANISSSQEEGKENIKKLMLQQLGIIKTIVSIPTEANQHLLSRLMALNENKANVLIDWQNIFQMIDLVYDGFYTQLNNRYSGILNEKEIQLCCLLKANFSTKEINMLTRQSLQTIYQRKTQIRQKLSIPEADDILHHLS